MQFLVVKSQFLLKGQKMFNFLFAFFLKISETLKAHTFGTKAVLTNGKELSSWFLTVFHIRQ